MKVKAPFKIIKHRAENDTRKFNHYIMCLAVLKGKTYFHDEILKTARLMREL